MELVAILRVLWRRRVAVLAGALLAVLVGFGMASPPTRSGIAWSSVALDTRPSQLVARTPKGADTLSWRSSLVTHLATSTDARDRSRARPWAPAGLGRDHRAGSVRAVGPRRAPAARR